MGKFDGILLCTDLDGTYTHDGEVCADNAEYVSYFQKHGGLFTVVTGRLYPYIAQLAGPVPNVPVISHQGCVIYDLRKKEVLEDHKLPKGFDAVNEYILSLGPFETVNMSLLTHTVLRRKGEPFDENAVFYKGVTVCPTREDAALLHASLRERFCDRCDVYFGWSTGVEYLAKGVSKGSALLHLRKRLGSSVKTVYAFGDSESDTTMFSAADVGCAVENASEVTKEAADIVLCNYRNGALAQLIRALDEGKGPAAVSKEGIR